MKAGLCPEFGTGCRTASGPRAARNRYGTVRKQQQLLVE